MPDYGQPLRFGAFITPSASPTHRAAELAVRAEEVGLDLVTFQDHPYQPGFLDTWTLLSWVAARTERVELAGNVLNLPLRQPAVLARSAASLDLLSEGRVALGIGSGAFWDAIEAMGGRRLAPGAAVDALTEAIEIIRGIWDTDDRRPLRVHGEHHRVDGAKRGPAPAHAIPVWIGAYKPRMLRLVGRSGDGWLPSLSYLQPGDLARGNATIDAAAREAGRDPASVERLLNVPPGVPVEELVRMATEDGISTFVVMGDDPDVLRHVATEVAPAVREEVDRVRSRTAPDGVAPVHAPGAPFRGAAARARRHPGIAYDDLPASLAAHAVEPGDRGYGRYTSSYFRGGAPGLVLRPQSVAEVQEAVQVAARHRDVPFGVLSGGHGMSGRSLNHGGIVLDLGALDGIDVLDGGRVRLGPGARWIEVARALTPHGLAITSGDHGGVGVGGLATAGGIGWFAREHGLTIDHLTAVDVVLADGTLVRADAAEHPDLFWGVRGAGANLGVVVSFELAAVPVGTVAFAHLVFETDDLPGLLVRWGQALEGAHRSVTGQLILGPPQGGRQLVQALLVVDSDDPEAIADRLQGVAAVAPLVDQSVGLASYEQVMGAFYRDAPHQGRGEPRSHSGLAVHLTRELADAVADLVRTGASSFVQIRSVGGAVADVPADATAYAWRDANFSIIALGGAASLDRAWEPLLPHLEGLYLSFETDTDEAALTRAFPPAHLGRLRELKRRYDPTGLFRDNFFVDPEA